MAKIRELQDKNAALQDRNATLENECKRLEVERKKLLEELCNLKLDLSGTHPKKIVDKEPEEPDLEDEFEDALEDEPDATEDGTEDAPEDDPDDTSGMDVESVTDSQPQPRKIAKVKSAPNPLHQDGPGKAYIYWDHEHKMWILKENFWAAKQLGGDLWEVIWVWYQNGIIDHVMTPDEILKYIP